MKSNLTKDNSYEVRVIETDQAAVSATVRRLKFYTVVVSAIGLVVAICAFCIYVPLSGDPLFHKVVTVLIGTCLILLGILHFIGPLYLKKMDVLIERDFIAGPNPVLNRLFPRLIRYETDIRYDDIVRVLLNISKDRITGATIVGKGLTMILVRRVTEPHTVIRAIREHAGPDVQWRRSPPRYTKLTGDDVDSLIDKTEREISMNRSNSLFETNITQE